MATAAETAQQPAAHLDIPRLIGNTGEFPEFIVPKIEQEEEFIRETYTRDLEADFLSARSNEESLRVELEKQKENLLAMREKTIGYNTLQREVETNRNLYEGLLQRLKEVSVAANLGLSNISIVEPAVVPHARYKPNTQRRLLIGLLAGLLLGLLAALTGSSVLLALAEGAMRESVDALGAAADPDAAGASGWPRGATGRPTAC